MDSKHKKLLNKYRVRLLQDLDISPSFVSYLQAVEIMSRAMKEDIDIERKSSKKAALFLDLLERRGERAFDEFYNALIYTEQAELADLLKPEQAIERRAVQHQRVEEKKAQLPARSYQLQFNPAVAEQYQSSQYQSSQYQSGQYSRGQSQPNDIVVISNMNSMSGQPLRTSSDDGNCISTTSPVESNQSSCPVENDECPLDKWPADDWVAVTEIGIMMTSPDNWKNRISGGDKYYTMLKRGRAIIINNMKFKGKMGNRPDSKEDVKNLNQLLVHLGYNVFSQKKRWQDLTAEKMRSQLHAESRRADHQNASSFVCVILSHGNDDLIYDANGSAISINEITTMFNSKNSPHLAGKPKIFIIQTCKLSSNGVNSESSMESNLSSMSFDTNDGDRKGLQGTNDGKEVCDSVQVPDDADMIVVSSTTEGTDSFSPDGKGSWFIQAVVYVFVKYAHNTEIRELFTKVNQLMLKAGTKQARTKQASDEPKLTSQIDHNTLQKDLYLYPGLNSD